MKLVMTVATLLGTLCVSDQAAAQSAACVSTYLAKRKSEPTLGIAASDAERLVSRVARSLGLMRPVTVVPCTFAEKAHAWVGKPDDDSPEGEYIVYNPDWVREVLGKDEVQAVALFGHELGHFLNGDFTTRKGLPRSQLERDADRFAGCAVARLSGDFSRLENLLARLRLEKDAVYPDRLTSIQSAKEGFDACGGAVVKKCRLPDHGVESWGYDVVVSRSSNWRGGGGSQPGYCAELQAQLRGEYPDAQEVITRSSSESSRNTCAPFNCPNYQYHCTITVRGKPVFKELESKKCP
ncbi:hypothetical protein [Aquincola sp. J276]|uniref:hypothetical protein n=1 Tax=Aquincola sp. J276 TaxID=2898432 RepID=UPI0021511F31|nr:hypothetical protein [Aquincola sp. J276]MCR5867730.1 hypothetical protein [Aquincola sp. J276]